MSFLVAPSIPAYSDLESDDLKIDVTALPVALSAVAPATVFGVAERGALPAPNPEFVEAGVYVLGSFDDWYYRIHVIPAELALGNLTGDTQRTVVVFNAFFEPKTLEAFVVEGDGISADSTVLPPQDIPPLEAVEYVFSISANGPSVIDGTATWTIDGEIYIVPITGRRSVLFGFRPDWRLAPVNETLEWKNTLSTSYDGKREQIMAVRQEPRRIIDYRFRLFDEDARLFDMAVFGWTGRVFGLPLWHEKVKLTADAGMGAEALALDTLHSSFVAGGSAVLFRTANDFEILEIETVSPTGVTTSNSLSRLWPAGSTVIPVMPAVPANDFNLNRSLPRHVDSQAAFTVVPTESFARLPDVPPAASYRGYELYTQETNWRSALPVGMAARRKLVDGGFGTIRTEPKARFPLTTRGMSWLLKNRVVADDLRAFFGRRKGRRVPFWAPSGAEDFVMALQSELGETALRVKTSQYASLINNHPARRDIVLVMRNGDRLARRILLVEPNGEGGSTITVDTGMPYVIRPQDVKRISFLGLYRMSTDSVTFAWRTAGIAEVDAQFTLKEAP